MTLPSQIQKQCLISSLSFSGLNYCRQALSRQHQANITSNIFLFQIVGTETRFPQRFNMLLSLPPTLPVHIHYVSPHSLSLTHTHLLSALLDLIPRESNFAITQNSRSKRQSPDFMSCMGIRRSVQNKPPRGILLVRKEGDYSEPVQISFPDSLHLSHARCLCT